jgi:hypothetical protein
LLSYMSPTFPLSFLFGISFQYHRFETKPCPVSPTKFALTNTPKGSFAQSSRRDTEKLAGYPKVIEKDGQNFRKLTGEERHRAAGSHGIEILLKSFLVVTIVLKSISLSFSCSDVRRAAVYNVSRHSRQAMFACLFAFLLFEASP